MPNDQRRHDVRGSGPSRSPQRWEIHQGASVDKNMFVEVTVAKPDYTEFQRLTVSGNDASAAAAPLFSGVGYMGLSGYVVFEGTPGGTEAITLNLYGHDPATSVDFLIASTTLAAAAQHKFFDFADKVKNRWFRLVVSGLTLGASSHVDIYATGE